MPLALNLVGQPDSGYLTTGATDYANAVTAGKKSALELQAGAMQNEKYALDLSALKEKTARDTAISGRLPDLIGAADKAQLTAQNKADLMQYNPELANKIIATNDAKVKENISNFLGSSLLKLAHSTDAESDKTAILDAVNHYGIPLNLSDNPSPEELKNAMMVAARGVDALKDTTMSTSPTGERITTTRAGEVTDIKPAEKVKQPVVPALDAKGNEITKITPLGYGKTVKERKMSDGTWAKLGESTPPTPKAPTVNQPPSGYRWTTGGNLEAIPGGPAALSNESRTYFNTDLTGEEFLKTLTQADQNQVKALVEGREPYPSQKFRAMPKMARLLEAARIYDPRFSATTYSTRQSAEKNFAPGGSQGKMILANASALDHMDTLEQAHVALKNNQAYHLNKLANMIGVKTGGSPQATFEAIKGIVAKEIVKSVVAGGGGVEERRALEETLSQNYSPDQFMQVMKGYKELMQAQQNNMRADFDRMGLDPRKWPDYKLGHSNQSKTGPSARTSTPVQIRNAADYNALPSGTSYIDPNGVRRKKP